MRQLIILFTIIFSSPLHINAQTKLDCSILGREIDTVVCENKKMIVELSFCESNGLYQDGMVTNTNGNEVFVFFYKYDNKNKIKKITFWTFQWQNGGYVTKDKIGVLKIIGDKQELSIKGGFTLNPDFVKLVTKT